MEKFRQGRKQETWQICQHWEPNQSLMCISLRKEKKASIHLSPNQMVICWRQPYPSVFSHEMAVPETQAWLLWHVAEAQDLYHYTRLISQTKRYISNRVTWFLNNNSFSFSDVATTEWFIVELVHHHVKSKYWINRMAWGRANLLPLTKKFFHFFEKATAPTPPMCPMPTPMQFMLSEFHNLTYLKNRIRDLA